MHLSTADVAAMLGLREQDVLSRVSTGDLPGRKIGAEYHFLKTEIDEYILRQSIVVTPAYFNAGDSAPFLLAGLLKRGGLVMNIPGTTMAEVIQHGVHTLPAFPGLDREDCIRALLSRESQLSTAIGGGIAIPHPRSPIIADCDQESITVLRPAQPVVAISPDGLPVHTMFLVLSSNARRHLEILARLAWVLSDGGMRRAVQTAASLDELVRIVSTLDQAISGGKVP
ncbi:MAG TPA: PTS sugar transporter subunit IIA [Spirochaetota bacterium]|nr:PTS sugar transporter subunit IIA [Spirochaetota bacterium]HPN81966.1 PTS sugar transporter subunit IIA [Spirochaetota bacterium]